MVLVPLQQPLFALADGARADGANALYDSLVRTRASNRANKNKAPISADRIESLKRADRDPHVSEALDAERAEISRAPVPKKSPARAFGRNATKPKTSRTAPREPDPVLDADGLEPVMDFSSGSKAPAELKQ